MNNEWNSVNDLPDESQKYEVKRSNGDELSAYFYSDKMQWIALYGAVPCHWWESFYPHNPIFDVTYWRKFNVKSFDASKPYCEKPENLKNDELPYDHM